MEFKDIYDRLGAAPDLKKARFVGRQGEDPVAIAALWQQSQPQHSRKVCVEKTYVLGSPGTSLPSSFVVDGGVSTTSPSGRYRVVFEKAKDDKDAVIASVLDNHKVIHSIEAKDKHGPVYAGGTTFHALCWSKDELTLFYSAEKKRPKAQSWWAAAKEDRESTSSGQAKDDAKSKKRTGEAFVADDTWGEGLANIVQSTLFSLSIEDGNITEILEDNAAFKDSSLGQLDFTVTAAGRQLLAFSEWPHDTTGRLGLIYCINRPSWLHVLDLETGQTRRVAGDDQYNARSPRFSPSGSRLVWLSNKVGGPHASAARLMCLDTADETGTPAVTVEMQDDTDPPSLYCLGLPRYCFASEVDVIVDTAVRSTRHIMRIDLTKVDQAPERLDANAQQGTWSVCDVRAVSDVKALVAASFATPNASPTLMLGTLDVPSKRITWVTYEQGVSVDLEWRILPATENGECFVVHPKGMTDLSQRSLIVCPHGGPHSVYSAMFSTFLSGLALAGHVLVVPNYRGSLGFGERALQALPGNAGSLDVTDVNTLASHALDYGFGSPDKVAVFGGSHGGFLSAHLTGQHPERYKLCAMRNPVIDISAMLATTDIPDWCCVEAGVPVKPFHDLTHDERARMRDVSPIAHVGRVQAPTLVLIGQKDLRVPPEQGRMWHKALRQRGIKTKLHEYPDDSHPLASVDCDSDVFVAVCNWFSSL